MQRGTDASGILRTCLERRRQQGEPHTQQWLSEATGIQVGTINGYCTGRLRLGADNAVKLAAALEVSPSLLQQPDSPPPDPASRLAEVEARVEQLRAELRERTGIAEDVVETVEENRLALRDAQRTLEDHATALAGLLRRLEAVEDGLAGQPAVETR